MAQAAFVQSDNYVAGQKQAVDDIDFDAEGAVALIVGLITGRSNGWEGAYLSGGGQWTRRSVTSGCYARGIDQFLAEVIDRRGEPPVYAYVGSDGKKGEAGKLGRGPELNGVPDQSAMSTPPPVTTLR